MHLRAAARHREGKVPRQSPEGVVPQSRPCHGRQRLSDDFSPEATAARLHRAASFRLFADPCHVSPAQIRQHPIGTGPFKFVEFKPNEYIKVTKNPGYWKKERPYLDAIEYTILPNRST